ncbi:hypothetical protein SAMN05192583_2230 [Sphingomonas gellani]|uniref:Dolichyl-phosphate-mannose-protein mannosyltransferase n=1 Tax=Sphingomonas gellani TaxID=1166340 RepID=A0A1H8ENY7_9SPHN|nr:hypothetical protein [Sphingomonas gellani]SEN20498.1 hypothetical protein SAMN05192583_2230 [Sphingomonas gellani]
MSGRVHPRSGWIAVAAITLFGLALRLICARGGLWLDEAWSVLMVHEVGTPAGVFLSINHDNNHFLNSLWLQWVGMGASPLIQRALSIATGTAAIPVAANLAVRQGRWPPLVTALLFATAPILVTLGSEARGYAPMTLCFLLALRLADRALAEGVAGERSLGMAICFVVGVLAQLTMVFGVVALIGWAAYTLWRDHGAAVAARRVAGLFGPALLALGGTLSVLWIVAERSPTGFHFGSYEAFTTMAWLRALVEVLGFSVGVPLLSPLLIAAALALLVVAPRLGASRMPLYLLAMVGFPLSIAVLRSINPGHARYYLLVALALLLLLGEVVGRALSTTGWPRRVASGTLGALLVAALWQDAVLAVNLRADPMVAIASLRARAPSGATVLFDRETGEGVLRVAASQSRYALIAARGPCPPSRFVFLDRFGGETMPLRLARCGARYRSIGRRYVRGMSGTHWALYERQP